MSGTPVRRSRVVLSAVLTVAFVATGQSAVNAGSTPRCPAGTPATVSVASSQMRSLQALVDQNPPSSTFKLPPGRFYRFSTIAPCTGDTFDGAGVGAVGTRLYGSIRIASGHFVKDRPGRWKDTRDPFYDTRALARAEEPLPPPNRQLSLCPYLTTLNWQGYPDGFTNPGLCSYPDTMYSDGKMLRRELSVGHPAHPCLGVATNSRSYCINYATGTIYVGFNPKGHLITLSGFTNASGSYVQKAFTDSPFHHAHSVTGVKIENLRVLQFANPGLWGAIQAGSGWVVSGVVVGENHACGVTIHGNAVITHSFLLDNGQEGACLSSGDGSRLFHNAINGNNQDAFSDQEKAGGVKVSNTKNVLVARNVVMGNDGNGLWFDNGDEGMTVLYNVSSRNTDRFGLGMGDGIRFGIACYSRVSGNTTSDNAGDGITLNGSHNLVVDDSAGPNRVTQDARVGRGAVVVKGGDRPGRTVLCGPENNAAHNLVRNNVVTITNISAQTIDVVGTDALGRCRTCLLRPNLFSGNRYFTSSHCGAGLWMWWSGTTEERKLTFTEWLRVRGQAANSESCR